MDDPDVDRALAIGASRILAAKFAMIDELPAGYVHDPAIVFLLSLFIDSANKRVPTHDELCRSARHVPFSAATRWIKALEGDGMIVTRDVPSGGGPLVHLSTQGLEKVRRLIIAVGNAEKAARDSGADALLAHAAINHGVPASNRR